MKVLLIGNGAIGKRYGAVLRALKANFDVYDNPQHELYVKDYSPYSHVIIASPTHTHVSYLHELEGFECSVLCEKPLTKNMERAKHAKNLEAFIVNNYQFLPCSNTKRKISYDFFNTGKDGLIWDVCQLVYLAWKNKVELEVRRDSFWWNLKWGQHQVPYHEIEKSYYHMLKAFLVGDHSNLWDMEDAVKMSELCFELNQKVVDNVEYFVWKPNTCGTSGPHRIYSLSKKNSSKDRT